ncbi:MAG: ORF6N domain-containing protein [Flavobacteriales bacterium]|nr:ORF6N domain-containing protein [Flavobacteriales bacterium]
MSEKLIIPDEVVISKIYYMRDQKVMLDSDLSELYGVETRVLNQQVKRNEDRFPDDFMFQLTDEEWSNLKAQNEMPSWGGRRKLPFVFTEHGVLMLSSVLNSKKAIAVNIQIMRIFTKLREMLLTHKDLLLEMEALRKKVQGQDDRVEMIYKYLLQFIKEEQTPRKKMGFKREGEE